MPNGETVVPSVAEMRAYIAAHSPWALPPWLIAQGVSEREAAYWFTILCVPEAAGSPAEEADGILRAVTGDPAALRAVIIQLIEERNGWMKIACVAAAPFPLTLKD